MGQLRATVLATILASGAFLSTAAAQTTIRGRVLIMVDTSGSMAWHFTDNNTTGGDGTLSYTDGRMTRSLAANANLGLFPGRDLTPTCPGTTVATDYDGSTSRMTAAKIAVGNVINAAGEIDWGLMRYTGTTCPFDNNVYVTGCAVNGDCGTGMVCSGGACICNSNGDCTSGTCDIPMGLCTCTTDEQCRTGAATQYSYFCIANRCVVDGNMCFINADYFQGADRRPATTGAVAQQACGNHIVGGVTYGGNCGTTVTGGVGTACATPQNCYVDADCAGTLAGRCALIGTGPARSCRCNVAGATCTAGDYVCDTTAGLNRCVYARDCQNPGGTILVDPAVASSGTQILPYVDGIEDFRPAPNTNPELHAVGATPLAGAARSATAWYNAIKAANSDPQILCRPYVLVQMTDGDDSCETGSTTAGPIAAARGFVAATATGAKTLNKVYVISLSSGSGGNPAVMNSIAAAGGTGAARFANNSQEIQAALADIVASSVLVEKCNALDDDCNNICDDGFPDVAIPATPQNVNCTNRGRAANTCNNGQLAGTHCFASGVFQCSVDTLSQVCSAATCATNPALCPLGENAVIGNRCNGVDDDCNGVVDDCTPFVPNSCCTSTCPACAAGGPFPETCNGCDDNCDGIIDNALTDTGATCGTDVGQCSFGTTFCCQQMNPTPGTCTQSQLTVNNPDRLFCLGGVNPAAPLCNGCDNDCDGQIDRPSQNCFTGPGTAGVGICRTGTQQCTSAVCPSAATFGACSGQVTAVAETCNGLDDNCDGTTDNAVTDVWLNTACCPTGNLADCTNTGTGTRCRTGTFQCVSGAKTCVNAVAKSPETCNLVDDDCNGPIDDVPGLGGACTGGGTNTTGTCRAAFQCVVGPPGPGPGGLTCVQTVGPVAEVCNGLDDNCNGATDDGIASAVCGTSTGECSTGMTACVNGVSVCNGSVGPQPEVCNNLDDNCDGMTDNAITDPWVNTACCSTGSNSDCTNTGTGTRCRTGTNLCVAGVRTCNNSVAKSAETCNGVDDDCNGPIDDIPGINTSCTGGGTNTAGVCTAQYRCVGGVPGPGPSGLTCTQVVGPSAELCNGLDDNCNGLTDDSPIDVGQSCGVNIGVCTPGLMVCTNGTRVCSGGIGPSPEVCNGLDDNCNGQTDESPTDPWLNQQCCPTGNLADCGNTGTGTRCRTGIYACVAGAQSCGGAVAKSPETCNNVDDNCDGPVDNIAGLGGPCTGVSVNTVGACRAIYACNGTPGPDLNGMTCTQSIGPMPEICNGIDDNCNGQTDEGATDVGMACGSNCPGGLVQNCIGACRAGATACVNGARQCVGSTGPALEVCDLIDNDCNGATDDVMGVGTPCTGMNINTTGQCTAAWACTGSVGPGPNGLTCTQAVGPSAEICNGVDDDCNGQVDDNLTDVGQVCADACPMKLLANCVGQCKPGISICLNGAKLCSGSVGPSPEVCDGIDNNCNGLTDDALTDPWLGQQCCPTGNLADCTNTGGGTQCRTGMYVCTGGGRQCSGGVARAPETCNAVDDNCNGVTDDVPGIGLPCQDMSVTTIGLCTAAFTCNGSSGPGPNGLTCSQLVGPMPEMCNGVDDDCDGTIDNNLVDPRVGVKGGMPCVPLTVGVDQPPCDPGTTACKAGAIACVGAVGPMPNVCGKGPTDCTGTMNMANCPTGLNCVDGQCLQPCAQGEFPCPGGFVCDKNNNCIPDACAKLTCPFGFTCQIGTDGMAACVDRCMGIVCPNGTRCSNGGCIDNTCKTLGCPTGQICDPTKTPAMCVPDPCANVMCETGSFCDKTGKCVKPCENCAKNEICVNSACVPNPCNNKMCPSQQVCAVVNSMAVCIDNQCLGAGCPQGTQCCQGMCINDPCLAFTCAGETTCVTDAICQPTCVAKKKDQITAAGGGGFGCGCTVGAQPEETPSAGGPLVAALLVIGAILLARRRRR